MKSVDRDLVELSDLAPEAIRKLLHRADQMRTQQVPLWRDSVRHVGLIFAEPSTRTSLSFVAAIDRLGAYPLQLDAENSSFSKGETLLDTASTLESIGAESIVVRDGNEKSARSLAEHCDAGVINAGGGTRAHPTQGLLDALTLLDEFGDLEGKTVGIVGDVLRSRVARSDIVAFQALGARVVLVAPDYFQDKTLSEAGVELESKLDDALPHLDAIQMLRIQKERGDGDPEHNLQNYVRDYRLDERRLALARPSLVVLHPGPMNREVEITSGVADGPRSRIRQQVANGVPVRMAVLERALGQASG